MKYGTTTRLTFNKNDLIRKIDFFFLILTLVLYPEAKQCMNLKKPDSTLKKTANLTDS